MRKNEALAITKRLRIGDVYRDGKWQHRERRIRVDEWDSILATITFGDHVHEDDVARVMTAMRVTLARAR
jgi:hypothetical protein